MGEKVVIVRLEVPSELWGDLTTRFAIRDALKILETALGIVGVRAQVLVSHPEEEAKR